jgi:hypothetical protein
VSASHGEEVRGFKLTINEGIVFLFKMMGQMDKCQFRGTWDKGKHALAKESSVEFYAI